MKKCEYSLIAVFILAVLFLALPGRSFAAAFEGPLQVKNQFPVFLPLNAPYLEQAAAETSFSLSLSHSSVFVVKDSAQWAAHLDIELTELAFRYKKDIPGLFELGVDAPVLRAEQGFLDRPVAWIHENLGTGDYGRHTRPYNDFLYEVKKDGSPLIEGDNGRAGFGDVRLTLKRKITGTDPVVSILADVELPTGNARAGYGNGTVDAGVALLLDKKLGENTKLYGNIGAVSPGDLKALQTVELNNFVYAGAGIESLAWPHVGLLAQLMVETSPYPNTGISQIDNTGMILVLGGRYYAEAGSFELSLTEDPNTSGAPDFILNFTCKKKF